MCRAHLYSCAGLPFERISEFPKFSISLNTIETAHHDREFRYAIGKISTQKEKKGFTKYTTLSTPKPRIDTILTYVYRLKWIIKEKTKGLKPQQERSTKQRIKDCQYGRCLRYGRTCK